MVEIRKRPIGIMKIIWLLEVAELLWACVGHWVWASKNDSTTMKPSRQGGDIYIGSNGLMLLYLLTEHTRKGWVWVPFACFIEKGLMQSSCPWTCCMTLNSWHCLCLSRNCRHETHHNPPSLRIVRKVFLSRWPPGPVSFMLGPCSPLWNNYSEAQYQL